ncbi:MAG: peptidoglycan editing factor PgeF [Sulfurovum sp.]|nr:peptidoglycan editing factor PgeF [Sulfurovum sp.]MCB4754551.1 peptidoglycan editing factor PgeF [Sulfurovum sp.]MCB4775693.1 peptidoglycan editing factor PgeF [Sulfurovum sp.]
MINLYRFKLLEAYPKCFHAVTMKSNSAFFRFSLALHTGETPEYILRNRRQVERVFNTSGKLNFVIANQIHSDNIYVVTKRETAGWKDQKSAVKNCDALITNQKEVMLGILTADCVPVLLYDYAHQVVAAIHAGWKGTKAKIVFKTVKKMQQTYGSNPEEIIAGIAPSIGKCCYEVGKEVAVHFCEYSNALQQKADKYMLDLPLINRAHLIEAGLQERNIEMSGICTACDTKHFFSYRQEQKCSGRFMSLIGISPFDKK